ncbi:dipeptide epimerase [Mucilaginibacter arboris]|uniref:Dipeptide epimerase n=1 Tax=Mucilaginibacter arboris TaxID=2682090 RepID=A0A7K1SSF0_9SPHI|nr:dipeptide epimerase [Mucilaginibacter arboris]MVN20030.1 dipeptide epimerase [Mucilaginibacter arboris]
MKLTYQPYELELKHPFTISKFSRTSTPLMLLKLDYEGFTGYGEASMVPYMGENLETAAAFLQKVDLSSFYHPFLMEEIMAYLDSLAPGNPNIKAAIDIAFHDLIGKIEQKPCYQMFGSDPQKMPVTSYTLGLDTPEMMIKKAQEAASFKVIKIKLGRDNDEEIIRAIRSVTQVPLYVDANQGWTDRQKSLDKIFWLHEQGVELIEQPMDKNDLDGNAWLTENSPVAIIGDEAVQRFADVEKAKGVYHGINMKLMKSAGMYEGYRMILKAKESGLKVLIGCMSETSCATLAAAALAPLCDWADLDGPFLTKNNPYQNPDFADGKYVLKEAFGLGLRSVEGLEL